MKDTKYCQRCSKGFEYNADDINHVDLNEHTKLFISKTNYDYLCSDCLFHFNELIIKSKSYSFPVKDLMEGIHYYKENNKYVFTELYLMLRGYCCKNGCRHCVYGFKKD